MSYVDIQPTDLITQGGLGLIRTGFVSVKEHNHYANLSGRCEKMNIQTSNPGVAVWGVAHLQKTLHTHSRFSGEARV